MCCVPHISNFRLLVLIDVTNHLDTFFTMKLFSSDNDILQNLLTGFNIVYLGIGKDNAVKGVVDCDSSSVKGEVGVQAIVLKR